MTWNTGVSVTLTPNNAIAPDGSMTADTMSTITGVDDSSNRIFDVVTTGTGFHSASLYMRSDTLQNVRLKIFADSANAVAVLEDFHVTSDWQRFSLGDDVRIATSDLSLGPA